MSVPPPALLLDTCAAIWLAERKLSKEAFAMVAGSGLQEGVFISVVTAWEVGLLGRKRATQGPRLQFKPDPKTWFATLMAAPIVREAPFDAAIAIGASELPGDLHNDPADRLLIATARAMGIPIMTGDQKILRYAEAGHVHAIECAAV